MKEAVFKHKKTQGLYTVVARATASLSPGTRLMDLQAAYMRKIDAGSVVVEYPVGVDLLVNVQAPPEGIENGTDCVIYRGLDGRHWVRPYTMFTDGRYEPMNPQAACMMPPSWHMGAMGA